MLSLITTPTRVICRCSVAALRPPPLASPAEGVQGDFLDFKVLFEWANFYFGIDRDVNGDAILDADSDEVYEHNDGFRFKVYGAVFRLCTAFEAVEKMYRSAFGTTGAKKKVNFVLWSRLRR
ncbi:hypothetical protein DL768_010269 [Monosporascus sp. mg162]|nr:hypothetical protein DL768_010269 [Monosporascus sp. mg162]